MGIFLQPSVIADQITKDNCPNGVDYKDGLVMTLNDLTYISNKKHEIYIKTPYLSDGYSIPLIFKSITGGSHDLDNRPSTLHDAACQYKGYYDTKGNYYPLSFKEANDLLYESMRTVGISWWKCFTFRIAVNFNPKKW
jgi:hypothetical protein